MGVWITDLWAMMMMMCINDFRLANLRAVGRRRNGASRWVSSFFIICAQNPICSHTELKNWFKPVSLNERAMRALDHNRRSADRLFVESNCIMSIPRWRKSGASQQQDRCENSPHIRNTHYWVVCDQDRFKLSAASQHLHLLFCSKPLLLK